MQYPSGPQNAPMPLSHTGNRLGYICSREVSGEKSLSDRSGPSQSKPFLSFEYARLFQLLLQGLCHLCAFHKGGLGSCNQNQIIPIFNFWGQKSGRLPYHPSGTVALHRISNFFTGSNPDPQTMAAVFQYIYHHYWRNKRLSPGIRPSEIAVFTYGGKKLHSTSIHHHASYFPKRCSTIKLWIHKEKATLKGTPSALRSFGKQNGNHPAAWCRTPFIGGPYSGICRRAVCLEQTSKKSVGQASSSLRSAAGQNLASVSVRHSLSEAVLLFSVQLLRLVRSQHTNTLLSGIKV